LAKFLGARPGRGRRREKAWRDFSLAADIQELVNNGRTVDQACGTISERLEETGQKLDSDTLHNIFFRETRSRLDKRAIEAELLTRAMHELLELQNRASPSAAEAERVLQLQEKIFAWQEKFNARRL